LRGGGACVVPIFSKLMLSRGMDKIHSPEKQIFSWLVGDVAKEKGQSLRGKANVDPIAVKAKCALS